MCAQVGCPQPCVSPQPTWPLSPSVDTGQGSGMGRYSTSSFLFFQAWLQCPGGSHSPGPGPGAAPAPESPAVSVPLPMVYAELAGQGSSGSAGGPLPLLLSCPALQQTVACIGLAVPSPPCSSPASGVWGRKIRSHSLVPALPPAPLYPLSEFQFPRL